MLGHAVHIDADRNELFLLSRQHLQYGFSASDKDAVISPATEDTRCPFRHFFKPCVVLRANGIFRFRKFTGIGRPESEEVGHEDAAETPVACQRDAFPDGRVVFCGIGCGRIQEDDPERPDSRVEDSAKDITVAAAGRNNGSAFYAIFPVRTASGKSPGSALQVKSVSRMLWGHLSRTFLKTSR